MKHLFASCAVIALMAAPALAQSTATPPNDPLSEENVMVDAATAEEADVTVDADVQTESDVMVVMAPETEAEAEDEAAAAEVSAEAETEISAEAETDAEAEPMFQAEVADETEMVADAEMADETEVASVESVDAPIDVAELPAEYSTDDLNAMMLAQLNDDAEEIASITFVSETESYASADTSMDAAPETETYASTESADSMTSETAPSEEPMSQDYAATDTEAYVAPETYASTETEAEVAPEADMYASTNSDIVPDEAEVMPEAYAAMEPVAPALEESTEMGEKPDDTMMMAEQSETMTMTAEGDIDQNAVEIAAGDSRFTTLVELVGIAGLEDDLAMEGPYTVFAPTNEAFAALPAETLARLKTEEGKPELIEILKAHVVSGAVMAADVPLAGEEVQTISDHSVNVMGSTDGTLNVGGTVHTVGDGIYVSNGVVYAVDAVILPETPQP